MPHKIRGFYGLRRLVVFPGKRNLGFMIPHLIFSNFIRYFHVLGGLFSLILKKSHCHGLCLSELSISGMYVLLQTLLLDRYLYLMTNN
ncbi:unnamed protein product [Gordionus sp. m RMFG-2023]